VVLHVCSLDVVRWSPTDSCDRLRLVRCEAGPALIHSRFCFYKPTELHTGRTAYIALSSVLFRCWSRLEGPTVDCFKVYHVSPAELQTVKTLLLQKKQIAMTKWGARIMGI
jgi:hypothetical protein